ncbi:MAG TPA: hypothetical protein VN088_03185, partial [Nocardioides sp.]|nr:hypothetical protein [Nocardioides sp.]
TVPQRAPQVGTGRFVTRLAARPTYLRLERSRPGTTLHVGAQLVGRGSSIGEGFAVEVGTEPDRDDCGSAVAFRPTLGEPAPVLYAATSTWTSVEDHPCATDTTLYLTLRVPTDRQDVGRALQLRIYEEPAVSDSSLSLLTTPSPEDWSELSPGVATAVQPGHLVDAAPEVTDGTYAVTLRPGDNDFLAVPVDWGQTVRVQLDAELPAAVDPADPGIGLHVLGPLLDSADTGDLGTDPEFGPTRDRRAFRTGVMTETVAYINRESVNPAVNGADLAGVHYIALSYVPPVAKTTPVAVRVTVQIRPGDSTAPLYTEAAGVRAPVADSRLVDGSLADRSVPSSGSGSASRPAISEDRSFPWLSIAIVLGGVVVVGGLLDLLIQLRRRRRERYHGRHR